MNAIEKDALRDTKSGESSPAAQSDIEAGSIVNLGEPNQGGDAALRFLKSQHAVGALTAAEEKKLVRKIDWMIMPLMWSCYCLQYLDKTLGKTTRFLSRSVSC